MFYFKKETSEKTTPTAINNNRKPFARGFLLKNLYFLSKPIIFLAFCNLSLLCPKLTVQPFFSRSKSSIAIELLKRITGSRVSIFASVYAFTHPKIAQALIDAKNRGVVVTLILDRTSILSPWGKAECLINSGIDIFCKLQKPRNLHKSIHGSFFCDQEETTTLIPRSFGFGPLMHNKYAVFDKNTVWTGSFNWTISADSRNNENVIVISNAPNVVAQFAKNFEEILKGCTKIDRQILLAMIGKR